METVTYEEAIKKIEEIVLIDELAEVELREDSLPGDWYPADEVIAWLKNEPEYIIILRVYVNSGHIVLEYNDNFFEKER